MAEKRWTKRRSVTITCPSGVRCEVRRPGPEIGLKGGKLMRILIKLRGPDGKSLPFAQMVARLEQLDDNELASMMVFAREVVIASLVSPRLVAKPSPGIEDEIGPDDIDVQDFWYIFDWAMQGGPEIPVETKEGETTVAAVENFSDGPAASVSPGEDSGTVKTESSGDVGAGGSDDSAGVQP